MPISHKDAEAQLERGAFASIESEDEQEVAILMSAAISLKRIADFVERIEPILRRPPRT